MDHTGDDGDAQRACLGGRVLVPACQARLTTVTVSKMIATQTCHGILVGPFRSDREAIHGENVGRIVAVACRGSPVFDGLVERLEEVADHLDGSWNGINWTGATHGAMSPVAELTMNV